MPEKHWIFTFGYFTACRPGRRTRIAGTRALGEEVAAGGVLCGGVVAGVEGHARQGVNGQRTLNQAAEPATRLEDVGRLVAVGDVAMLLQELGALAFADAGNYDPGNGPCNNQPREVL